MIMTDKNKKTELDVFSHEKPLWRVGFVKGIWRFVKVFALCLQSLLMRSLVHYGMEKYQTLLLLLLELWA